LHVIERRHPSLEIILVACRVQGQGAGDEIACGIRWLNEWATRGNRLDAILATRGGGSLEDLWAFNEEVVARAIFHSQIPVVSAVGHEIDLTISDFVADLRAATPSAGAELLTEGMMRRREWVRAAADHLSELARERIREEREDTMRLAARLARVHPKRALNERAQRVDDLQRSLGRCTKNELRRCQLALLNCGQRLARVKPSKTLALRRQVLTEVLRRLQEDTRHALDLRRQRLVVGDTRLRLLSPQQVLERGFSITQDANTGEVLREAKQVSAGARLKTTLAKGEVRSVVEPGSGDLPPSASPTPRVAGHAT
jgi:exodeoxyribonuclease VII large subunit